MIYEGLDFIASSHGVQLQKPLSIDSRGEISIVALPPNGDIRLGCGQYGEFFAQLLCDHKPRTGVAPGRVMLPENGWCHLTSSPD